MDMSVIRGYPLRGVNNLDKLPRDARDLIAAAAPDAFLVGTWSFDDLSDVLDGRYIVVCRRSRGQIDETMEWTYDTVAASYALSDRAYGSIFSMDTIVARCDSIQEAIQIAK
jgi:hypothetical protein